MSKTRPQQHCLFSIEEIRAIEARALAIQGEVSLMQKAGLAAAEFAARLQPDHRLPILILAGPGNNGGDAFEAAAQLHCQGYVATVVLCGRAENYSTEALAALQKVKAAHIHLQDVAAFLDAGQIGQTAAPEYGHGLIIDGLFGIGLKRAPAGHIARLIEFCNQLAREKSIPVLALDVPSGLNADTGQLLSQDGIAIRASHTISFIADKPGLHTAAGQDFSGIVEVCPLDIPQHLFPACKAFLNERESLPRSLLPREQNSHKGSFGDVIVLGGATGMAGAAILAARAAQFAGAGRVYCGMLTESPVYDSLHPELMFRHAADLDLSSASTVIGPGLGNSALAHQLLARAIQEARHLLIDADALNLIAADHALQDLLTARPASCILTPHPLEAARLLGLSVKDVQADRLQAARQLAQRLHATVILKGSGSIICNPVCNPVCNPANNIAGELYINVSGNPALASGGTGDVLAGLTGALLAQACPLSDAARIATWLHGHAADELVAQGLGPIGLTASELLPAIRLALNQLAYHRK